VAAESDLRDIEDSLARTYPPLRPSVDAVILTLAPEVDALLIRANPGACLAIGRRIEAGETLRLSSLKALYDAVEFGSWPSESPKADERSAIVRDAQRIRNGLPREGRRHGWH
jgi:hypothetical protein